MRGSKILHWKNFGLALAASLPILATLGAAAISSPAAATPPPIEQLGANCTAPSYASDQLVCSDQELLAADRQMLAALQLAGRAATEPDSPLVEAQSAWLKRRSMCAMKAEHRQCLQRAYYERTVVLQAIVPDGSATPATPLRCAKGALSQARQLRTTADSAIVFEQGRQVIAVAFAVDGGTSYWQPFVSFARKGRKATITPLGTQPTVCTFSDRGAPKP